MDTIVNDKKTDDKTVKASEVDLYREPIKKALYAAIGNALEEENRRVVEEMLSVRENAIKQIMEEEKSVIKKIVDDEKKTIWTKALEENQSDTFNPDLIREKLAQTATIETPVENKNNGSNGESSNTPAPDNNHNSPNDTVNQNAVSENTTNDTSNDKKVELEILPPRDQDEIAAINTFLINMPEAVTVELLTLIDKSVFRVKLRQSVDFIEKLGQIPQVLNAEEVTENGQKKIKITLLAKSKRDKNQNEVNEKVKKIFNRKK